MSGKNVTDLVVEVSEATNYDPDIVKKIMNAWLEVVMDELSKGHHIKLRGFGSFVVIRTKRKRMYNRWRREIVTIPAKWRIRFKPSFEVSQ